MKAFEAAAYISLLACSIFANKYVLSVLGFQFPMVFQGWQTLVGCITFKLLSVLKTGVPGITSMDWSGFASLLPNFVLFTIYIIAGSKALASLPVIIYISAGINLIPSLSYLVDVIGRANNSQHAQPKSSRTFSFVCTVIVVLTSAMLLLLTEFSDSPSDKEEKIVDDLMYGAKFWLCVHVGCGLALSLHTREFADQRFSFTDRLFYSYAFSLVVLLPASLYLEEAFEALHFRHRQQYDFVIGSLIAALVGVSLNVYQAKLKEDKPVERLFPTDAGQNNGTMFKFGLVHHTSLAFCALISAAFFHTELSTWAWIISIINIIAVIPIPSHITPDENIPILSPFPGQFTKSRHFQEEDNKPKKHAYTDIPTNSSTTYDI